MLSTYSVAEHQPVAGWRWEPGSQSSGDAAAPTDWFQSHSGPSGLPIAAWGAQGSRVLPIAFPAALGAGLDNLSRAEKAAGAEKPSSMKQIYSESPS